MSRRRKNSNDTAPHGDPVALTSDGRPFIALDITDERRQRFRSITSQIIELLENEVSPAEAYAILRMLLESLERTYDFQGTFDIKIQTEKMQ